MFVTSEKFNPDGERVMLSRMDSKKYADRPYIVGFYDGKNRVFQPLFSYGGWCWRALPFEGPQHNVVMAVLEKRKTLA